MIRKILIVSATLVIAFVAAGVSVAIWLFAKMDADARQIYKGFDEREIANVVDYRKLLVFYGNRNGSTAPISDYIRKDGIKTVCLDQPYGLPEESLGLNGLPEPDDGVSYISFFVEDGKHY